jgi:hypothetical protein
VAHIAVLTGRRKGLVARIAVLAHGMARLTAGMTRVTFK